MLSPTRVEQRLKARSTKKHQEEVELNIRARLDLKANDISRTIRMVKAQLGINSYKEYLVHGPPSVHSSPTRSVSSSPNKTPLRSSFAKAYPSPEKSPTKSLETLSKLRTPLNEIAFGSRIPTPVKSPQKPAKKKGRVQQRQIDRVDHKIKPYIASLVSQVPRLLPKPLFVECSSRKNLAVVMENAMHAFIKQAY